MAYDTAFADRVRILLDEQGVDVFGLTGRVMKGWLTVSVEALDDEETLQEWVDRGVSFASGLPPKPGV